MMEVEGVDDVELESKMSLLQVTCHLVPSQVLEHILGFLPVASIKSSRLVNSDWAKAGIAPMMKKTVPVSFCYDLKREFDNQFSYAHEDLERFVACLQASVENFPVSKFGIMLSPFDNSVFKDEQILDKFFMAVSPTVTELTLVSSLGQCRPKNWPGSYQYPKLTSLKLKVEFRVGASKIPLPIFKQETFDFIERILGQAPKLKMVSLEFGEQVYGVMGECLGEISGREMLLTKLTHLQLNLSQMMGSEFSKLDLVHGLNLKGVKLICGWQGYEIPEEAQTLYRFLESQTDSLRTLELLRPLPEIIPKNCGRDFKIPGLRNLEHLKIASNLLVFPILEGRNFPALKQLQLESPMNSCLIFHIFEPFGSLEELIISGVTCGIALELVEFGFFPNITKLGIEPVCRSVLQTVYREFPNLVELQLTLVESEYLECADSIITGLSKEQLTAAEMEIAAKGNLDHPKWHVILYVSSPKSVASLRHLKVLKLLVPTEAAGAPLEFGLVSSFVLKSMESLKILNLGVRSFPASDARTQSVLRDLREEICVVYDDPPVLPKMQVKQQPETSTND